LSDDSLKSKKGHQGVSEVFEGARERISASVRPDPTDESRKCHEDNSSFGDCRY
jgi:hypothetical protein